jgi:hypothetical protein
VENVSGEEKMFSVHVSLALGGYELASGRVRVLARTKAEASAVAKAQALARCGEGPGSSLRVTTECVNQVKMPTKETV